MEFENLSLPLQSSFSSLASPVVYYFSAFTPHIYALSQSLFFWVLISIVFIALGILLSDSMDSVNKLLDREYHTKKFLEDHQEAHKKGSNDGRVVDLSFFNISLNMSEPDPERPSKAIFDKNDANGTLLPIIFPERRGYTCVFIRNGIQYRGYTSRHFTSASHQAGVMERIDADTYITYVRAPSPAIMNELRSRGISVFSGNQPLRTVIHTTDTPSGNLGSRSFLQVHIYANRTDAIGVFDPNDTDILPNS